MKIGNLFRGINLFRYVIDFVDFVMKECLIDKCKSCILE